MPKDKRITWMRNQSKIAVIIRNCSPQGRFVENRRKRQIIQTVWTEHHACELYQAIFRRVALHNSFRVVRFATGRRFWVALRQAIDKKSNKKIKCEADVSHTKRALKKQIYVNVRGLLSRKEILTIAIVRNTTQQA